MDGRQVAARAAITAHNLALETELLRIHAAFVQAGIQTVVLKGLPLMRRIGEELSERRLADNDLLVRREEVARAEALLGELGYMPTVGRTLQVSLRTGAGQHLMVREVAGHRVCLELHWEAFHPPFTGVDCELVWSHTERQTYQGQDLIVFDRPLTLVHTAAHYVWHAMGQPRLLRTFGRAWTAFSGRLDFNELREIGSRTGTLDALDYTLRAAEALGLAEGVPDFGSRRARVLARLLPAERLFEGRPAPDYDRIFLSLLLVSSHRAGRHAARMLLPTAAQVGVVAGNAAPGRIALHYLGRPARTMGRWISYRLSQRRRRLPQD